VDGAEAGAEAELLPSAGCSPACTANGGVCHSPAARCDCPVHLTGPSCERQAVPACRIDAGVMAVLSGAPGVLDTGCLAVSTCACLSQCAARGWPSHEVPFCANVTYPPVGRFTPLAALLEAPLLVHAGEAHIEAGMAGVEPSPRPNGGLPAAAQLRPLSACPSECTGHGLCVARENGQPACSCFLGWAGHGCDLPRPMADTGCPGECNRRGNCSGGWCACQPGAYGADCGLEGEAAEELAWGEEKGEGLRPRIYVYTLPPAMNIWFEHTTPERNLGLQLHERLLASRYRTADPDKADFFYLPVSPMGHPNNLGQQSHYAAVAAAAWARDNGPHWNRSGGRDHLAAFGWDFGGCPVGGHPLLANVTLISHFGLRTKSRVYRCDCPLCSASYTQGKDIVVPDTFELDYKQAGLRLQAQQPDRPRPTLLFFAGHATGPDRRALFAANLTGPGVRVVHGRVDDLAKEMADAQFCISAPGAGFGSRGAIALAFGCLPVAFVDDMAEPWEDVVDWPAFGVRIRTQQLPQLVDMLRSMPAEELAGRRAALACAAQHFWWSSIHGALGGEDGSTDAFETLMYALRRRLAGADAPGAPPSDKWPKLGCGSGIPGAPAAPLRRLCGWREAACRPRGVGGQLPAGGAACGGGEERPC